MAEDSSHMNDVGKDLIEEVIEFEQPGVPAEGTIHAYEGRTEKIDAPAA